MPRLWTKIPRDMEIKLNLNREASIQDLDISVIISHYMLPTPADLIWAGAGEKGVKFELEKNVVEAPQSHGAD